MGRAERETVHVGGLPPHLPLERREVLVVEVVDDSPPIVTREVVELPTIAPEDMSLLDVPVREPIAADEAK